MNRLGMTIPFDGIPLHTQAEWIAELARLGYTDVWSSEANGADGFAPLALASVWAPSLRLGSAIVPAFTRGPATLAQCVATMADAAPGRFVFGIGTSSQPIVERWNDISFDEPYKKVRDTVEFLRVALRGDKVREDYETFSVKGFKLAFTPEVQPEILIAALRPGMLRLAGRVGDGAIINWLSADDVAQVVPHVHDQGDGKQIVARIFVMPTEDVDTVRQVARFAIAAYLNVEVYAKFHEWLGRGEMLQPMWDKWQAGDRAGALAAIPDELVDQLVIHGTPAECRAHIQRYVDNGVDCPAVAFIPGGYDVREAMRAIAPAA